PPSGPPQTPQNGYSTQHQSYFNQQPTSPTANDGQHFQLSSQHNSPQSPSKFRSSLSSALQNEDVVSDLPRSTSSFNVLGPLDAPFPASVDLTNNQFSRQCPFAHSVPTRFGIMISGATSIAGSIRERVTGGDCYVGSGKQSPSQHGESFGSRYGSPNESQAWPQDSSRAGNPLHPIHAARNHPS